MSANCELLLFFQFMANFLVVFSPKNTNITFPPKNTDTLHTKNADVNKIKRALVLKGLFFETTYVYLRTKFQVSSVILTSFRILSPPQSPPKKLHKESLKSLPYLGLSPLFVKLYLPLINTFLLRYAIRLSTTHL